MPTRPTPPSIVPESPIHHTWWGVAIKVAVAAASIALLAFGWFVWVEPREAEFEAWLRSLDGWAPVCFIASVVVATSVFLPKSLFSIASGAIFGPVWGLLWILTASVLSATLMFAIVRWRLRGLVVRQLATHPRLAAIDEAVAQHGTRLVVLLRMTPISFAAMNLSLAASRVGLRAYLVGLLGLVPGTISTVAIGFAARHTADLASRSSEGSTGLPPGDSLAREIGLYVGVAASVIVTVVVSRIAISAIRGNSSDR